jgi:hypothetical protein
MSGHWFRLYDDAIFCPKILRLTAEQRWFWITFLAIYSGNCPKSLSKMDLILRSNLRKATVEKFILALKEVGLIDETDQGLKPHNWEKRQYKSDFSADRTRRWRDVTKTVTVTPPDTDTDTDTDTDKQIQKGSKQDSPPPEGRNPSAPNGANTAAAPNGASTAAAAGGVTPGPTRTRTGVDPYVFEEGVIRLNQRDLSKICEMYPRLNIRGELTAMAGWAARFGTQWWVPVMNNLAKKEREFRDRAELARVTANANDITRLFPKPPGSW